MNWKGDVFFKYVKKILLHIYIRKIATALLYKILLDREVFKMFSKWVLADY